MPVLQLQGKPNNFAISVIKAPIDVKITNRACIAIVKECQIASLLKHSRARQILVNDGRVTELRYSAKVLGILNTLVHLLEVVLFVDNF